MYKINPEKKIALIGGGEDKKTYLEFLNKFSHLKIAYIYDAALSLVESEVKDIPLMNDESYLFNETELIIVVGRNWRILCNILFAKGLVPFRDFIVDWVLDSYSSTNVVSYSQLKKQSVRNNTNLVEYIKFINYDKKIALVYGNCQVPYIVRYLSRTVEFQKDYMILSIPPIHTLKEEKVEGLDEDILKRVKLFVYQIIKEDNRFSPYLSSTTVMKKLPYNCIRVAIPNVFWGGYFPQICPNPHNPYIGSKYNAEGIFPYGDSNINTMFENQVQDELIYEAINKVDFYDESFIKENAENSLLELKNREKKCDICISDFIKDNYKEKKLFFVPNHPTNIVIEELSRRILKYLGYKNFHMNTKGIPENDNLEVPIYPSVSKALELKFDSSEVYFCKKFKSTSVNLKGYIEEYIKYCMKGK